MQMKLVLGTLTLVLALMTFSGSALAGTGQGGSSTARGANAGFPCERAAKGLARVESLIAKIDARIQSGQARRPELAAKLKQWLEKLASRIEARIAANC